MSTLCMYNGAMVADGRVKEKYPMISVILEGLVVRYHIGLYVKGK